MNRLNPGTTGLSLAITVGVLYLLCALLVALAPGPLMTTLGLVAHGLNLTPLAQQVVPFSPTAVLVGLLVLMACSFLAGLLFGLVNNTFIHSKIAKSKVSYLGRNTIASPQGTLMKICMFGWLTLVSLAAPVASAQSTQSAVSLPQQSATEEASADPAVLFHFAGYADVTFANTQGDAGNSGLITFAPIFHLQFADRLFLEAELEGTIDDRGQKAGAVEYATVNWLLNDNAALVVGKFLSPVGYFFQNMHPSWINRMASVPAGFGHGGAAPLTDVGVQLRGGKTFAGGQHVNYAIYHANGPRLGLEGMDDLDLDVEGSTRNPDGKRVTGGRLGWMPVPSLEVGASLARGDVVLDAGDMSEAAEPSRRYRVDGVDAAWHPTKTLELRGEWIRQRVGDAPGSVVPDQATWRAWYLQGAYRFGAQRWETVLRLGDSVSPHGESTFRQTAIGLNYLFRPNALAKLSWEFNDSANTKADADRLLLQLAYGF